MKRGPLGRYQVGAGADATAVSRCWACAAFAQYLTNWALLLDFALNTLLAGDPNVTVSQRAALARAVGSKPAAAFCAVLTWVWKHLFRSSTPDHCTWALAEGSIGREIWSWRGTTPPNPPPPPQDR